MNLIKSKLRSWLLDEPVQSSAPNPWGGKPIATAEVAEVEGPAALRVNIHRAMNGYTVQVMRFKHNPHGPDWTGELLVCKSSDELMDAIKTGITVARLEK